MKIKNDWLRILLALGMYISCFIIAFSPFQISKELSASGSIPLRMILMLIASFIILGITVYFSDEPAWKTTIKLLGYSLSLFSFFIGAYGTSNLFSFIFGEQSQLSFYTSLTLVICGFGLMTIIGKAINSKRFN